jgi:LacI family transcriptional regulator/LacI family asc operon transcriptional repressor
MEENKDINIYDIAKLAGVSIATVSRVINQKGNVTERTKRLVEKVIRETNYQPNIFARGLGLGTMKVVGVLCSTVIDMYYAKAVGTIEEELRSLGYDVILSCTGNIKQDKLNSMEMLLSKHVDAMVLIGSVFKETDDNSHIERIAQRVPVVLINGFVSIDNTYCVVCEEENAMFDVIDSFVKIGRKDILYLEAPGTWSSISKMTGFRKGLEAHKLPFQEERILSAEKDMGVIRSAVKDFLKLGLPVSAVCASEDLFAVAAMKVLIEKGYKVPEDVAIMGFNNSLICECATPPLSSVDNRVVDLSKMAISILVDIFEGKTPPQKTVIPYEFIIRETMPRLKKRN